MMIKKQWLLAAVSLAFLTGANASPTTTVTMNQVAETGAGAMIGTLTLMQTKNGVLIMPNLQGITGAIHGFHIHEKPDCEDLGMAAGGHFDPYHTGKHEGPYSLHGHKGDLPVLIVNADGTATLPVLAPHLKLQDFKHHAVMIHVGGDNYSDTPEKLGGGGARFACGVVS